MTGDPTAISQTIFTATITAASLTFIMITQIMIWVENKIESKQLQGFIKLRYSDLQNTIVLFLTSNVLVILYWLFHSLLFQITSFQIGSIQIDLDYLIIASLLVFFWAVLTLLAAIRHFIRVLFTWENDWRTS